MTALKRPLWAAALVLLAVGSALAQRAPEGVQGPSPPIIRTNPTDGAEMVWVPAGEFLMGTDKAEIPRLVEFAKKMGDADAKAWFYEEEMPQHKVKVDGFWLYKHEVTNEQFEKFVKAMGYKPEKGDLWRRYSEKYTEGGKANHPVVYVTWKDAVAYCQWAGGRLPTEAEWEYAARRTDARQFPWENDWDPRGCNFADKRSKRAWSDKTVDDGYEYTAPVGSYPQGASPFGALDMTGNVCEWCSSLYKHYPYSGDDGREDSSADGARVVRGGSWDDCWYTLRVAFRYYQFVPSYAFYDVGFRVVVSAGRPFRSRLDTKNGTGTFSSSRPSPGAIVPIGARSVRPSRNDSLPIRAQAP